MRKFKLYTIMLTLLSFSAFADVGTPGGVFRDIIDFFKGIFTGGASIEQAYLISFLLYFIIFMAVFIEGIRAVPIFGASGETNRQGTIFAVAAAALSTLALFIVDTTSKMTTTERVNQLISPWGIWGGVAIAALIAFITYRLIIQSDAFSDQVLTAMAIAAAVGVTLAGFLLSLELLVGWGFLIALVMFVVGFIRAFMNVREEGAEGRATKKEETREASVKRFKDADEARKARKETAKTTKTRKKALGPVLAQTELLRVNAESMASEFPNPAPAGKTAAVRNSGVNVERAMRNNITKVRRALNRLRSGSDARESYKNLFDFVNVLAAAYTTSVRPQIPVMADSDADWNNKVTSLKSKCVELEAHTVTLETNINDLIDGKDVVAIAVPAFT